MITTADRIYTECRERQAEGNRDHGPGTRHRSLSGTGQRRWERRRSSACPGIRRGRSSPGVAAEPRAAGQGFPLPGAFVCGVGGRPDDAGRASDGPEDAVRRWRFSGLSVRPVRNRTQRWHSRVGTGIDGNQVRYCRRPSQRPRVDRTVGLPHPHPVPTKSPERHRAAKRFPARVPRWLDLFPAQRGTRPWLRDTREAAARGGWTRPRHCCPEVRSSGRPNPDVFRGIGTACEAVARWSLATPPGSRLPIDLAAAVILRRHGARREARLSPPAS